MDHAVGRHRMRNEIASASLNDNLTEVVGEGPARYQFSHYLASHPQAGTLIPRLVTERAKRDKTDRKNCEQDKSADLDDPHHRELQFELFNT